MQTSSTNNSAEILALIQENSRSLATPREDIIHICIDVEAGYQHFVGQAFCQAVGNYIDTTKSRMTTIRVGHTAVLPDNRPQAGIVHRRPDPLTDRSIDWIRQATYDSAFPHATPQPGDYVLHKHAYDSFQSTGLLGFLHEVEERISTKPLLHISGCFASCDRLFERGVSQCVDQTVLSALHQGYTVIIADDLIFGYDDESSSPVISFNRFNQHPLCRGTLVTARSTEMATALGTDYAPINPLPASCIADHQPA